MSLKKFAAWVLVGLFAISPVLAGGCAPARTIKDVTPQQASTLIQENKDSPDFVIIDVRTPAEFAGGHVADAVNLDYYSATFRDTLDRLDKSRTYLIYCRTGGRSAKARDIMGELGFQEFYNLSGGIIAWEAARLPTVK